MSKPICVFQSPLFTRSGYGDWGMSVAKSLLRYDKFNVLIAPTRWGDCPTKVSVDDIDPNDTLARELVNRVLKGPLNKQPEVYIQMTIPNEFNPLGKFNIGMTAGIETTMAAGDWIEGVNRMNLNILTSKHSKDVLAGAQYTKQYQDGRQEPLQVTKPMEVCFWGADTSIYNNTNPIQASVDDVLKGIPESFAYLFVGQWTTNNGLYNDRKDIGNLIRVFAGAFRNRKDKPCLILKTNGVNFSATDKEDCLNKIKAILSEVGGDTPNVYLLHGELSELEMNSLYNHPKIKVHVSFTHGEGYGHPLLLATLSGKPLLAPEWSGHLDFLNPAYATLLPGFIKPIDPSSANQWLIKESSWFYTSYSLAEEKMKQLYYGYGKAHLEKSEKLRRENAEKFSMQAMDVRLHGLLDKYVPDFEVEKKIVLPNLKKITLPKKISAAVQTP
jgi:hypothetical protein